MFLISISDKYFQEYLYSSLPNKRGSWNKRGGGKDEPVLISVVTVISVVVATLNQRGAWNKHGSENFQATYSNKKKNKMKYKVSD